MIRQLNEVLHFCSIVERYVKNSAARQLAYFVQFEYSQEPVTREWLLEQGWVEDDWKCIHLQVGGFELGWWESDSILTIDATPTKVGTQGDYNRLIDVLA